MTLEGAGLRGDEYAVYSVLFDLGPLTATEMAGNLGMPLTTVLDYLRVMEKRRHIHRTADPRDGRARQIRLNPAGLAAFNRAHDAWERMATLLDSRLGSSLGRVRGSLHDLDDAVIETTARLERVRGRTARV